MRGGFRGRCRTIRLSGRFPTITPIRTRAARRMLRARGIPCCANAASSSSRVEQVRGEQVLARLLLPEKVFFF